MRERQQPPAFIVGREPGHEDEVDIGLKWLFGEEGGRLVVAPTGYQFRAGPLAEALSRWPPVRTATTRTLSQAPVGHVRVLVDKRLVRREPVERGGPEAVADPRAEDGLDPGARIR
jgi:hypothetical protein